MSHFLTVVITPEERAKEPGDIEKEVARLMAPFDEGVEVDPYETKCWCIGRAAESESHSAATKRLGKTIGDYTKEYWSLPRNERPEWEDFISELKNEHERILSSHPKKDSPADDCHDCKGTGLRTSTYNPLSKWDWYVIGGRWDGWVASGRSPGDDLLNLAKRNTAPLKHFLAMDEPPFAILTPDGEWYEKGKVLAFGMFKASPGDWPATAKGIFERYKEGYVGTVVDCHI